MGTTNSIADAAVRGGTFGLNIITPENEALAAGDIDQLIAIKRAIFGGATMMADEGGNDGGDGDGDDDVDDDEDDEDDEEEDGGDDDPRDEEIKTLKAENKRRRLKAREQDQKIRELEKKVQTLTSGKGKKGEDDDGEDHSERVAELEKDFEAVLDNNAELRIENAFLKSNKYTWKNPSTALRLLDRSEIDLGDDGEIEGLEEALDALAESDPYLLVEKKKDDDEDEDDEKPKRKRTGQPVQKKRNKGQPNIDALRAKYPALRR